MATRRTPVRQWEVDKRTATRIINRLMKHIDADAFAEPPPVKKGQKPPKSPLMNDSQVRAALGILKKYMPDLKAIEHTGNPDHPVVTAIVRTIVDPVAPADS